MAVEDEVAELASCVEDPLGGGGGGMEDGAVATVGTLLLLLLLLLRNARRVLGQSFFPDTLQDLCS